MGRKAKFESITDKWLNDEKWVYEKPFMIGNFICWETWKEKKAVHHMFDTSGKTISDLKEAGVPFDAIQIFEFLSIN